MDSRNFSERVQYQVVVRNLEKNQGQLKCEGCLKLLVSKSECHFDHIHPYAKGGKSSLENCQILCADCNLRKNDKELKDFMIEEKAKRLIFGDGIVVSETEKPSIPLSETSKESKTEPTLERPDAIQLAGRKIKEFVSRHGDISKADLSRKKNNLPTITEIRKYWGGLKKMKSALGIKVGIQDWNRDTIKETIVEWIVENGEILQNDLTSKNGLPSLPCILRYFPELKNFSEIKEYFGLTRTVENWTKEKAIQAGKNFIQKNGKRLRQHHLGSDFDMPANSTINRLFGNLREYQRIVGAELSETNKEITDKDIDEAVQAFFGSKLRSVKNQTEFFDTFEYSISAISRRFSGGISEFFEKYGITEREPKKQSYTKEDIDKTIVQFLERGEEMPKQTRELTGLGLPSADSIHKYYDSWREPFIFFSKMLEKIGKKKKV